ncbi:sialidase family protein [Pedobacter ginsenosidimutans]|uniref:sialidase family protein n=1 Tax=Pedobacter ginsenosidimutans TaxID=687842 RepID=UPI0009FAF0C1|nr:sialidase family protein [Pedobacter ginsenosidimutans]
MFYTIKNLKKIGGLCCFSALILCCINVTYAATHIATSRVDSLNFIFKAGENGYACFRIPALIRTQNGSLLAFAEARKNNCGDSGDIDLVVKRSLDKGKTWTGLQLVWSDSTNTCGNPVPIQDQTTGNIILISTWNLGTDHEKQIMDGSSKDGRHVYMLSSGDNGKTWSAATEITAQVKKTGWTWYATGPCHGLQVLKGKYAGRLVVPINHVETGTNQNFAHTIYSDDHGKSWNLGNNTPQDKMNETTLAEISKGRLMLNMRNSDRTIKTRHTAISKDGGQNWANVQIDTTLIEPICQGSLLSHFYRNNKPTLLFSNPANTKLRANLTLRLSKNDGKTWKYNMVLHPGPSAYSDIAVIDKQIIGCFFEAGYAKPYEGIVFKAVNYSDLTK